MAYRILLAAGGTGGHIIPSVAFGLWLQKQGESVIWSRAAVRWKTKFIRLMA